jgi:hypothetical protein
MLFLTFVVDLAQVENVPLHPAPRGAHLFSDAPIAMIFAVLKPVMTMQKWLGHKHGQHLTAISANGGRG